MSGLIGAAVLTAVHETARRTVPDAPRMDVVGMRALANLLRSADAEPPEPGRLHRLTFVGDLVSNALYYSTVAAPTTGETWGRGAILGLTAGVGAVMLPERLGLGTPPHSERLRNQVMTVAWYLIGGLAAAAAANAMRGSTDEPDRGRYHTLDSPELAAIRGLSF